MPQHWRPNNIYEVLVRGMTPDEPTDYGLARAHPYDLNRFWICDGDAARIRSRLEAEDFIAGRPDLDLTRRARDLGLIEIHVDRRLWDFSGKQYRWVTTDAGIARLRDDLRGAL